MRASFRLGRIAGVEIGVHYTWLFAFAFITWSLAEGFFPSSYRGWSPFTYWAAGAVAALLLFASVLVHELAHSFVAKARGLQVQGITLFIFGGVSNLGGEATRPQDEFAVAVVGPLTSVVIAALVWGLLLVLEPRSAPVGAVLNYLWLVNGLLAVFNLLPGFPLDGGRVLRSILWGTMKSFARATAIATSVGQACAWLLIGWGLFLVLQGNFLGGLWMAFIGWFLNGAADSARQESRWREQLRGVRVRQVMHPDADTVAPNASVATLVQDYFLQRGRRAVPVSVGPTLLGIVTLTDVKRVPTQRWGDARVEEIMTRPPLHTVGPEEDLGAALRLLAEHSLNQVLVVQGDALVGLLTRADVIRYLQWLQELGVRPGVPPPG